MPIIYVGIVVMYVILIFAFAISCMVSKRRGLVNDLFKGIFLISIAYFNGTFGEPISRLTERQSPLVLFLVTFVGSIIISLIGLYSRVGYKHRMLGALLGFVYFIIYIFVYAVACYIVLPWPELSRNGI
jgi:hypothetical protein